MTTTRNESRSPSRPRALISRIAAPFSPRPRHITDLVIETNSPRRVYAPGDTIRGDVSFTAHKSIRLTHLVIQIHGFVKVYRHATPPGEGVSTEGTVSGVLQARRSQRERRDGFTSILDDEQVLCGAGSIGPGRYRVPFALRFPARPLPSSLDFERGTISYVLVTVLTRPTTVAPTISCERKIQLHETVDVALMNAPKQRAVSLQAVSKRSRPRNQRRVNERESSAAPSRQHPARSGSTDGDEQRQRRSPSMSGQSAASIITVGSGLRHGSSVIDSEQVSLASTDESRTITAVVDILREGFLPGDNVPIRVTVKHIKPIKAMMGVIVTLYRWAHIERSVDAESMLDSSSNHEGRPIQSRTGLGGLLPPPPPGQNFRYDLDQRIEPLIINPNTMQGEVKASVRIPDDSFPSITSVPHNLISFTYHVEVVMDLIGKLSNSDRLLPRLSMTRSTTNYELGESRTANNYGTGESQRILDTQPLRRLELIAYCTFDIVIGNKDSRRKAAKKAEDPWFELQRGQGAEVSETGSRYPFPEWFAHRGSDETGFTTDSTSLRAIRALDDLPAGVGAAPTSEPGSAVEEKARIRQQEDSPLHSHPSSSYATSSRYDEASLAPLQHDFDDGGVPESSLRAYRYSQSTIRAPLPLPNNEEPLDEKERLRRHERSLLPSAPEDQDDYDNEAGPSTAHAVGITPYAPSAPHMDPHDLPVRELTPAYMAAASSSSAPPASMNHGDDKQELERQRLLAAASEPEWDDDYEADGTGGVQPDITPSAPPVGFDGEVSDANLPTQRDVAEEDPRVAWETVDGSEHLPEYQR